MRERRGWEGYDEGVSGENDGEEEQQEGDGQEGVEGLEGVGGPFNLTISPCLRPRARLGRINPAANPNACADFQNEGEDIVGSLGGILYLAGDAREGVVCLEGKVVEIHLEEEINNTCPSPKAWCSEYGSRYVPNDQIGIKHFRNRDECESAFHSITGEVCHWVTPPRLNSTSTNVSSHNNMPPYAFSTCTSQVFQSLRNTLNLKP